MSTCNLFTIICLVRIQYNNYYLYVIAIVLLDIMECKDGLHNCSQICVEREGEFGCVCYGGYELLEDGVSCKGMFMLYIATYLVIIDIHT